MSSVKELTERVRATRDPALALELLAATTARSSVEEALHTLERSALDDRARSVLRERLAFYFENKDKDRGATLREALVRLLVQIGHPDDLDMYLRALGVYEGVPPRIDIDVAQKLRAVALIGVSTLEADLAGLYAVKLLSEVKDTSEFSGEPALTALNLLVQQQRWDAIYQYVLLVDNYRPEYADVVSCALESFEADFPAPLYAALARRFIVRDLPVEQTGIVSYVLRQHRAELYPLLEQIVTTTHNADLHRYTTIELAAAREQVLNDRLFALAKVSPPDRLANFIEALGLVPGSDDLLKLLRARQR